jgi:hypothetical protein
VIPLLLAGCVDVSTPSETLDELATVAIVLDPPRPAVGDEVEVDVWVANPRGLPVDVLVWTCVPNKLGGCAESEVGLSPGERSVLLPVQGPRVSATVALPEVPRRLWETEREAPLLLWSLACVRGRCDLFDELLEHPTDPSLHERLDDPLGWTGLPGIDEAHLGFRRVELLRAAPQERNRNPRIHPLVAVGADIEVTVYDPDDGDRVEVRAVATSGVWVDGRWTGCAPGRLFVIATDGRDGTAVRSIAR